MKKIMVLLFALLFLNLVSAVNVNVEKIGSNEAMIKDVNQPAVFDLNITNKGGADNFQFYNLLGFSMSPKGTVFIGTGQSEIVELMIWPRDDFNYQGFYTFQYYIRGQDGSESVQQLTIKIVELEDAFEVGSGEIDPQSSTIEIYIHNKENFNFEVQLDKESIKKLMAGYYPLNVEVQFENEKAEVEGVIRFAEKDILTTTKRDYGFLINTQIIEKKNEGNTIATSETVIKKNILSRLFTTVSPEPDIVDRQGFTVYYTWSRNLNPGDSLEIQVKTNWLLPLFVMLFIIAIVVLAKQYARTDLTLTKKVSFVQSKGGEFALKVSVFVHANRYIEKVNVIDLLPPLVKIYEKFPSTNRPKRVNEKTRRIEWDFESLQTGETRVLSYIIYSKIGVMGKFALPSAMAIYERDGKVKETNSNRAFFITEPKRKDPIYRD